MNEKSIAFCIAFVIGYVFGQYLLNKLFGDGRLIESLKYKYFQSRN